MDRLLARLMSMAQVDKILGEWHSITGIWFEFSSMDTNFLYGRLVNKRYSNIEQAKFKTIYTIGEPANVSCIPGLWNRHDG